MIELELLKRFYTLINEVGSLPQVPGGKDPRDLADDLSETVHKIVLQVDRNREPELPRSYSRTVTIVTSGQVWTAPPEMPPWAEHFIAEQTRNATVNGKPQLRLINGGK